MIEIEGWKVTVAFAAGLLAFFGGLLTFINGRLKDADSPEGRRTVWFVIVGVGSLVFSALGIGLDAIASGMTQWSAICFGLSYVFMCILFAKLPGPVQRRDVIAFGAVSVTYAVAISFALAYYMASGLLDVLEHMVNAS